MSLSQRRAYLAYYSPVLMLRADESALQPGHSWITNFDFDRDGSFSTNKRNWESLSDYVSGAARTSGWQIRPTIYTALIEFMEVDGSKSLILLYHVYHAKQTNGIHDWERIEIRVNNVNGVTGSGTERVRYAAITRHYDHPVRLYGSSDLNFQETPTGRHVMIWQAQGSNPLNAGAELQELRFVTNAFSNVDSRVRSNSGSGVDVSGGSSRHNVHYVFVCGAAADASSYWGAQTLTRSNASAMASRREWRDTVNWSGVRRVRYELQDIADIFPTHWAGGNYQNHWQDPYTLILLESPITNESGGVEVPAGLQRFYQRDVFSNVEINDRHREGYPSKIWLWGVYDLGGDRDIKDAMWSGLSSQPNRATASGWRISLGAFWWQHDYFAHDGLKAAYQSGRWLPGDWYTPAAGGWDGRWSQIFPD
ncbi:MAG: hypothetical protein KC593_21405 [Myxococcales bacterium]|nr:hypothetical protein [Myxococcales bacterium]MCB9626233.1 hypothetical protein [Sandaracinaceae bacterium]